jgi:hypothetical protein
MDLFSLFEIPPDGYTELSEAQTEALASLACAALGQNRTVCIDAGFVGNLGTQQRPLVVVTMSLASPSTSLPRHQCSQTLGVCGKPQAASGEDATGTRYTSVFGKGE